jgi:hypothetical protein
MPFHRSKERPVTTTQHGVRIGLLMAAVAMLLGTLSARTEILFADGLRYVAQAERIEDGAWRSGLLGSVDHPVYPLAIAAVHSWRTGDGPESWQAAAQAASVMAGVLLVIPLYLVALELFGGRTAWLAVVLFYAVPLTGHMLADVLSEGTFLLFWSWGLWAALRFLRQGAFGWLPLVIAFSGLAYLTRPEGLLLPAALVVTLLLIPLIRSTRLYWPRWVAAVVLMVVGPALLAGPYVLAKGGLATKPAVARLLGLAPRSAADAVERAHPLDPDDSELKIYLKSGKEVFEALRDLVTPVLLPLSVLGLIAAFRPITARARVALFLGVLFVAGLLALVRLHVTGGYCSPRHAVVLGSLLIAAAACGLDRLLGAISIPGRMLGLGEGRFAAGPAVWILVLGGFVAWSARSIMEPINRPMVGYRQAGDWLAGNVPDDANVADATGWSLFYGERRGYTFATLHDAAHDPHLRWVVAREAHMIGPWWYCRLFREMVGHREPVAAFPEYPAPGQARVLIFDRQQPEVATVSWEAEAAKRRH